jgi:hypothetical protein
MQNWFRNQFHQRAMAGGEDWFGKRYRGGEFLPFYVPRPVMPQIEEEDYPEFLAFARERDVRVTARLYQPQMLRPHQRLDRFHAERMPQSVEAKPCYVSRELFILDGNHRWMLHVRHNTMVPCLEIELDFERAIELMFDFPKTYTVTERFA